MAPAAKRKDDREHARREDADTSDPEDSGDVLAGSAPTSAAGPRRKLKPRKIAVAAPLGTGSAAPSKNPFAGLSLVTASGGSASSVTAPTFNFGAPPTKPVAGTAPAVSFGSASSASGLNGAARTPSAKPAFTIASASDLIRGSASPSAAASAPAATPLPKPVNTAAAPSPAPDYSDEFWRHIAGLNQSFAAAVRNSLEKDRCAPLEMLFVEYEKHRKTITEKYGKKVASAPAPLSTQPAAAPTLFNSKAVAPEDPAAPQSSAEPTTAPFFNFGGNPKAALVDAPTHSFGRGNSSAGLYSSDNSDSGTGGKPSFDTGAKSGSFEFGAKAPPKPENKTSEKEASTGSTERQTSTTDAKPAFAFGGMPAFGSSKPASDVEKAPAPAFNYGSKPATGFGSTVALAFGDKSAPTFAFGEKTAPTFGEKTTPAFSDKAAPAVPAFGVGAATAFGNQSTSTPGSVSAPAFGSKPLSLGGHPSVASSAPVPQAATASTSVDKPASTPPAPISALAFGSNQSSEGKPGVFAFGRPPAPTPSKETSGEGYPGAQPLAPVIPLSSSTGSGDAAKAGSSPPPAATPVTSAPNTSAFAFDFSKPSVGMAATAPNIAAGAASSEADSAKPAFAFSFGAGSSSSGSAAGSAPSSGFAFGKPSGDGAPKASPFTFGKPASAPTGGYDADGGDAEGEAAGGQEGDPQEVVADQVVVPDFLKAGGGSGEDDAEDLLLEVRGRLRQWKSDDWDIIGVGPLTIRRDKATKRARVVMQVGSAGKPAVNSYVTAVAALYRAEEAQVASLAVLPTAGECEKVQYKLRVKDAADAKRIVDLINELKQPR